MNYSLSRKLAVRYLEGKCTIDEIQEVERLLLVPANQKILQQIMAEHWNALKDDATAPHDMNPILQKIHVAIDAAPEHVIERHEETPVRRLPKPAFTFWKVAASILVLVAASATLYFFNAPSSLIAPVFADREIKTLPGEITNIELPDGTMVWLNANSTLRYDADFSGEVRSVFLEGEAYFDVFHNPEKPFVVHAFDLDVKVLGTAFNVKSYRNEKSIETTLLRGKVKIENYRSNDSSAFELTPNERAVYSKDTKKMELTTVDTQKYTAWLQTPLIFEEETLDHVIQSLERRYNVKIHISRTQTMDCKLTARIRNESLGEMLELLKSTTSITYKIEGGEVFIEGKMCD